MATAPVDTASAAASDPRFFARLAMIVAAVIVFGFAQNAALGRVDIPRVPLAIHAHALVMLAWLGLFAMQGRLAAQGPIALHRRLGWAGLVLACLIPVVSIHAGNTSLAYHRVPPFFSPGFFLALTYVQSLGFAGQVVAGIALRRRTDWHRRLIAGGTIVLLNPALGRVVPMPLLGGELGGWVILVFQLGVVAVIARHDRATTGQVHPATLTIGGILLLIPALVGLGSRSALVIDQAMRLGG